MNRRVLAITVAVILAVIGTGAVLLYVKQADSRALAGQKAVTVLVAQKAIPAGTTAVSAQSDGSLRGEKLPAASVPANAVAAITPDLTALVLSADLPPGQLLLRPMLVTAAQTTNGLAIPDGMVAVTIPLCVPEDVAGNVQTGSQVAVFDTIATGNSTAGGGLAADPGCTGAHKEQAGGAVTRLVLAKVQVLAVGPAAVGGQSGSKSGGLAASSTSNSNAAGSELVTFAVNQGDAERLIQLSVTGLPYLALLTGSTQLDLTASPPPLFP
jgi:pilus assembly protein CpaB